jgi:DNA-binding transcriptional ArsR family regulator
MVQCYEVFAALGDPTRQRMVELLTQRQRTVSELAGQFSISLPGTLKHLRVLQDVGVVRRTKCGRTVTLQLEPEALGAAEEWLHRTRTFWSQQLGNLAEHFADESPKETR